MNNLLLKCGWLLTLGWLIFVGLLINKYKFPADLNSIGDFIAGMASPLAFLWVVIGYYQSQEALKLQAKELMQSTEALVNQAEEMRNTTKLQEEQLKEMRVQYESALVNERLKIQPFFDLQLLRYSEVSESDQFSLTLNFKLDCIEGYARSIRLIYNQGESSSFEIINLIRTGINNRLLLAVQIAKTHEMHDKFFDLEYYDLKNNMTTQRYVFMYRGDEKPEMIFEKFIFN